MQHIEEFQEADCSYCCRGNYALQHREGLSHQGQGCKKVPQKFLRSVFPHMKKSSLKHCLMIWKQLEIWHEITVVDYYMKGFKLFFVIAQVSKSFYENLAQPRASDGRCFTTGSKWGVALLWTMGKRGWAAQSWFLEKYDVANSFQKTVYLELNKGLVILFFLERKCQGFFGDHGLKVCFLTCFWNIVMLLFTIGQVTLAQ